MPSLLVGRLRQTKQLDRVILCDMSTMEEGQGEHPPDRRQRQMKMYEA